MQPVAREPVQDCLERSCREQLLAFQLQRLKALLAHVSSTNAFYSEVWRRHGVDIDRIDSLEDFTTGIPAVEKADFIADQEAEPPFGKRLRHLAGVPEPLMLFTTSGTSGQGQELHAQTRRELQGSAEVYSHMLRWAGLRPGDVALLTLPLTMLGGGRLEYHGAHDYGLTVLPAGNYDVERKLALIRRFRPKALIGTTSYFWHLAAVGGKAVREQGVEVLFCGGEGASLPWYRRLEEEWGARVFDRYGSTQSRNDHMFTCEEGIGSPDRPGLLHNIDSHVLLEVIDPRTGRHVRDGERGEVVITSLYHFDTPVIRCRMKDLATYRSGAYCRCGRQFSGIEIGSITRLDDMYRIKGINVWPQSIEQALLSFREVDEYEVVLSTSKDGSDHAELLFMPKSALSEDGAEALCAQLAEAIRSRIGLRFQVRALAPGGLARSEYKARRWIDRREHIFDPARRQS
ncbi:phenylacetate--CoA ligase family protein [Rhodoligotrophos defluvii]|uniref:phenylacetate--CoA ligase family protein n=1 Tax=Rhodoligotrophos defluvii TaxID=2561934 RepID=UPI0010C9CC9F|nr:AMP-binding protein [Rhodoligotrophos defluvii]